MRVLFVSMSLVFCIMFSMHSNAYAARQGGVLTKLRQLPVVQRVAEVWQGTSRGLAIKVVAFGIFTAASCGMMGCGGDDALGDGEIDKLNREAILQSGSDHDDIGKSVYLFGDDGEAYLGYVLGSGYFTGTHSFHHLVRLADGTEEIVHDERIGGTMILDSPDLGVPVEIIGDRTDDILTGVIKSAYGNIKKQYTHYGSAYWDPVAEWYVVRLDSGEERLVPVGSVVAWLN